MPRPTAVERFTGFADQYDQGRPSPPPELPRLLAQYAGTERPSVVDLAAGTGLSTSVWEGSVAHLTAIEPSADMRRVLSRRLARWTATAYEVREGSAEATGLADGVADVVTAGQAMHWFDPARALPEIGRILRPGGVFCAFDYDWPPLTDAEVGAAFAAADTHIDDLEAGQGITPDRAEKSGHLRRMRGSGVFRNAREVCLHRVTEGTAADLAALMRTQGGVQALLQRGFDDEQLGLTDLEAVASRRLPGPTPFWWTYRLRLGWK